LLTWLILDVKVIYKPSKHWQVIARDNDSSAWDELAVVRAVLIEGVKLSIRVVNCDSDHTSVNTIKGLGLTPIYCASDKPVGNVKQPLATKGKLCAI
jgi:hypothetical protein